MPCRSRGVGSESHTADILPRRCASGSCRSTPGVLGSEASSVVPLPHGVLRPHPSVSRARDDFAALPFIRRAIAVRERLGDSRDLPYFHCCAVHTCHRPYAGGSVTPSRYSCAPQYQASSISKRVATHKNRLCQLYPTGRAFRRCIVRFMLRPACLPRPPDWLQDRWNHVCSTYPFRGLCHPRFWRLPSPADAGNQARWANGKSPIIGTCTRPVTAASEAALETRS
jgi:hypothetical protein